MNLSKREQAWLNRKANSHPTYDQWGKKAGTLEERMKKNKVPKPFTPEAEAWDKERECKYADFTVTSTYDNRIAGKFFLSLTDEQTINFPDELYYDIMLTNTSGLKEYYVEGKITVSQSYTR